MLVNCLVMVTVALVLVACGGNRSIALALPDASADSSSQAGAASQEEDSGIVDAGRFLDSGAVDGHDAGSVRDASIPDAESEVGPEPHPVSVACGDGIRDPKTEECDDGAHSESSVCTSDCRVIPFTITEAEPDAGADNASELGTSPHVSSGTDDALGIVFSRDGSVWLQQYAGNAAEPQPLLNIAADYLPIAPSNAAVALLPDGDFAVAWTDGSSGTPDVRLRTAHGAHVGPARLAHDGAEGFQQDPDLLWVGDRLLVAWTDLLDVKYRYFDSMLTPLGPSQVLAGGTAIESSVALTPFANSWAAAVRENDSGLESVHIFSGDTSWFTEASLPSDVDERPALVRLDDKHLLVIFAVTDSEGKRLLHASVFDSDHPGAVTAVPFPSDASDDDGGVVISQRRPSAIRVGDISYVSWEEESIDGVALNLAEVTLDLSGSGFNLVHDYSLPMVDSSPGSGSHLHLGVSSLFPGGALISAWETKGTTGGAMIDLDFRPSPFVFLGSGQ